jgi:chromosome segregation ATPase
LQDAVANNKRLDETNHQLQAQNASLSQMVQSLRANAVVHGASVVSAAAGAATPTSTAQSRLAATGAMAAAGAAPAPGMEGPTPMRRRMASVNAQLERRVQELLQQKQALAAQVEQLQQQLGQQPTASAASTGLTKQQQAAWDELQAQVKHLINCNDELVQQLEELDWAHEQLQAEKLDLEGRLSDLEQDREQLSIRVQQLQQQAGSASTTSAAADSPGSQAQQVQKLQADKDRLAQDCRQLQDRLAQALGQLQALKEQQDANQNNTALFERCKDLKAQVQHLQQQLQQREVQAVRSSIDGMRSPVAADQQQELQFLRTELRELQEENAQQEAAHRAHEQQLQDRCERMAADLGAAQQRLSALQVQVNEAASSKAQLAADCSSLQQAVADSEASRQSAQEAIVSLTDRNKSLVDQLVQMQLATPAHKSVNCTAAATTADKGAQTATDSTAAAPAEAQRLTKRRWALDVGVQVQMGGTDAEQATAVQQLLLLQAQAQLHEMEEQNRQAAQRHVDSKQRIAQLQSSLTQQEAALQAAEQKLREAQQSHGRESASLQRENDQLVRQLADTRVKLQVLQTANAHLDSRVQQQQKDLQQHAAAANEAQLKVQQLAHQQNLDKLQVATVTAELTACRDHAQQLMVAQEKEARAVAALQQKLQQAQQDGQKASSAAMATGQAACAALEGRLRREVQASKEQVEQLMRDKNALMLDLQQTKVRHAHDVVFALGVDRAHSALSFPRCAAAGCVCRQGCGAVHATPSGSCKLPLCACSLLLVMLQATVDCLEDSVRRLGQHNAHLVQQIKDSLAAADSNTTGATAVLAAAAGAAASMLTPTSAPTLTAGAGSMFIGASSSSMAGAGKQQGAQAGGGPVSPRTLHSIIAAATRVNEKNKKLKRQLMAMQAPPA